MYNTYIADIFFTYCHYFLTLFGAFHSIFYSTYVSFTAVIIKIINYVLAQVLFDFAMFCTIILRAVSVL